MYKIPAAWLIEQCGWKGKTVGNAGVWHLQPLVLINATGKASAQEIINLENAIINSVRNNFGIELHPEVEHI
jgi:UDP-N-acetylmuramate dehydrogenase